MSTPHTPHLTFLLGGVRSGKSAKAVSLAAARQGAGRVLFVATAEALDDDMTARIGAHRRERPPSWDTLESPLTLAADLDRAIAEHPDPYAVIVIDCLTLWVSNILLSLPDDEQTDMSVSAPVADLLDLRRRSSAATQWIIVSNEVGLGVVPPTVLGRLYRDALGRANQLVAAAADDVTLMVAGARVGAEARWPLEPRDDEQAADDGNDGSSGNSGKYGADFQEEILLVATRNRRIAVAPRATDRSMLAGREDSSFRAFSVGFRVPHEGHDRSPKSRLGRSSAMDASARGLNSADDGCHSRGVRRLPIRVGSHYPIAS